MLFLIIVISVLSPVLSSSGPLGLSKAEQRRRQLSHQNKQSGQSNEMKSQDRKRKLKKKHKKPHIETKYNACMSYTCDELKALWPFGGRMPSCGGCVDDAYFYTDDDSGSEGTVNDDTNDNTNSGPESDDNGDISENTSTDDLTTTDDIQWNNSTNSDDQLTHGNDDISQEMFFNISRCESYSNYWLWDLALSCESSQNLTACECTTASQLMNDGQLSCPDGTDEHPYCPNGCEICNTCMQLLGCQNTTPNSATRTIFKWNMLVYIVAGIAAVMLGVFAMILHQRVDKKEPLLANETDDNVWLAPVSE